MRQGRDTRGATHQPSGSPSRLADAIGARHVGRVGLAVVNGNACKVCRISSGVVLEQEDSIV